MKFLLWELSLYQLICGQLICLTGMLEFSSKVHLENIPAIFYCSDVYSFKGFCHQNCNQIEGILCIVGATITNTTVAITINININITITIKVACTRIDR